MDFYDSIAESYDEMTGLDGRQDKIVQTVETLIGRYQPTSVIDAACGTGPYAVAFAQRGLAVVGADLSSEMLKRARTLAQTQNVTPHWLQCPMQELSQHLTEPADLIICLGNSLPHILNDEELAQTFAGFARLLHPGGVLVIHLLNYAKILSQRERIVAITRHGPTEFIRFYDFLDDVIRFNLLKITWHGHQSQPQLTSTTLRPYNSQIIETALATQGFSSIEFHGDWNFTPYNPAESQSLIVEAHLKPIRQSI